YMTWTRLPDVPLPMHGTFCAGVELRRAVRASEAVRSASGGSGSGPWGRRPPGVTSWAEATGQAATTAARARTASADLELRSTGDTSAGWDGSQSQTRALARRLAGCR